ncbi:polysaccharide deacetylase family protein [Mesorhizobium sp. SB112]|uniref:polysaccharide deacetylase family protein n=1 Tax=Mesorhizobium sp. SB112 TaxID=3151853 RepID=UPI0032666AA7
MLIHSMGEQDPNTDMPWKENYTASDEIAIRDTVIVWPTGIVCGFGVTVDLNPATGLGGIDAMSFCTPTVQFGIHEGIDHLLALFSRLQIRATFATPGYFASVYPRLISRIATAGHEIAVNGLAGEDTSNLSTTEELRRMRVARQMVADATGAKPHGWFSLPRAKDVFATGLTSRDTVRLAQECGFAYYGNGLSDDAPHYWVTDFENKSAFITLPYYYHFDDRFFLMFPDEGTGLERPASILRNWRAEFSAQYRRGRYFNMTVSPFRSAWGHRLENLSTFLSETARLPGVWFASGNDVATHWLATHPSDIFLDLQPSIWVDYEGSLS